MSIRDFPDHVTDAHPHPQQTPFASIPPCIFISHSGFIAGMDWVLTQRRLQVFVPEETAARVLQEVLPIIAKTCPAANANMCN